jgi:hypothetical protein
MVVDAIHSRKLPLKDIPEDLTDIIAVKININLEVPRVVDVYRDHNTIPKNKDNGYLVLPIDTLFDHYERANGL